MRLPWWRWLPFQRWRSVGWADAADEVPVRLPPRGVVLVGDPGRLKWVAFDCPCGRAHRILLNTDAARRPFWQVAETGGLTVAPSVNATRNGRRCHYHIRNGKILWAKDSDR